MTDLDHEAARIAAKLTKAQRAEVARLGAAWDVAGEVRLDASLADYNLVGRGRMLAAALTPLGLRVRDILSQDKSNG